MRAKVNVTLKKGVLDPQGRAVQNSLSALGFDGIKDVRQGKLIELELEDMSNEKAYLKLEKMCEKLLANTVIEDYRIEISDI